MSLRSNMTWPHSWAFIFLTPPLGKSISDELQDRLKKGMVGLLTVVWLLEWNLMGWIQRTETDLDEVIFPSISLSFVWDESKQYPLIKRGKFRADETKGRWFRQSQWEKWAFSFFSFFLCCYRSMHWDQVVPSNTES